MNVKFERLFKTKADLEGISQTDPFYVAACAVNIMCSYAPKEQDNFIEMLQVLMGDVQPITNYLKQNIKDRMASNEKWKYIGKSYFKGATPANNYEPIIPYEVEIEENNYSYSQEGMAKLFIKCGGADSPRPIVLRKLKDGRWLIWSDTIVGLMTGIKQPESLNPWA